MTPEPSARPAEDRSQGPSAPGPSAPGASAPGAGASGPSAPEPSASVPAILAGPPSQGGVSDLARPSPLPLQYRRFTRLNRVQHVVMIVSFMTLALTGLTLKFSYTGWARVLSRMFGGFESAGYVHRVGAVLLMITFATHLTDLVRRRNREYGSWAKLLFGPDTMMFTRRDLSEFIGSILWFLGKAPRPRYGRWTYWEKFDYFAVFWGMTVIGSTGLVLWFPVLFTMVFPGWMINIATIIHSDEALLAVGFIFTVHFFNTHLRPEKFPMDLVIFTGQMSLREFREDKPGEFEDLVRTGRLESHLVEAYPPIVIRTIRAFAWTALTVGSLIVLWIIYAMVFAYR